MATKTTGLLSHPDIKVQLANDKQYNATEDYSSVLESLPPISKSAQRLKILLLEPLYPADVVWGSLKVEQGFLPPLGLISIYTFLKYRGYNVQFVDTQFGDFNKERLSKLLVDNKFDVVGIPTFTTTADYCFETAALVREVLPKAKIVFGNIHASSQPELTFAQCPVVDFIVKHEGEFTFDELLRHFADGEIRLEDIRGLVYLRNGSRVETPERPFIKELDVLPRGFYSDLDMTRYIPHPTQYISLPNYPFVTQRGCPYPCSFCEASVILGKKLRVYSPERVIEELKILKYEKGAKGIYFQDSTFTMNKEYVMKLFDRMIKENLGLYWTCNTRTDRVDDELCDAMYKSGCRQIFFGIESGNQKSLDVIRKQVKVEVQTRGVETAHRHKISTLCNYILCLPGETEEMTLNTIEYAKSLASRIALFYLPVPYPGSTLYQTCKETGGLRETDRWSDFLSIDFDNPVYVNPLIGKKRMQEIYKLAYRSYYSSPRVWLRNLEAMLLWGMPFNAAIRGVHAFLALVGLSPLGIIRRLNRGYHGQAAPALPMGHFD